MPRDWKSLVDQLLDEARDSGTFDNLPGGGRPLKLDDDPYTPDEMKLAHKILKEHDLAPEWIMLGKEVDARRARLLDNMRKGVRAYQGRWRMPSAARTRPGNVSEPKPPGIVPEKPTRAPLSASTATF